MKRKNTRVKLLCLLLSVAGIPAFALPTAAPGSLDTTFGTNGIVTTDINAGWDEALAVALQPDGKIVAAGYTYTAEGVWDLAVTRYNKDGTPDIHFGKDGITVTSAGSEKEFALAVIIQPDMKILVAGHTITQKKYNIVIVRYNQ